MKTINFDELTKTKVELDSNSILKNGYGLITQDVMRNKNITLQARGIYSYLCAIAGSDGIAYPTQSLMIDELNMNKTTFNKYLKEILSTGYIKVTQTRKNGKMYKNVYTIAMDKRDIEPNRKAYAQIAKKNKSKRPSTQVNNLPSQCIKICDIDVQCHKKQETEICDSKSNSFKNNIVVVDAIADNENKIIDLYKSFKLEKRVTPHMIKLLKQFANKFDIEIFEDIFINTLEKKPDSNFKYIRHILETLDTKGVYTFEQYKLDTEKHRASKSVNKNNSKKLSSNTKVKNTVEKTVNCNTNKPVTSTKKSTHNNFEYKKTGFHNFNATYCNLDNNELDDMIERKQNEKYA